MGNNDEILDDFSDFIEESNPEEPNSEQTEQSNNKVDGFKVREKTTVDKVDDSLKKQPEKVKKPINKGVLIVALCGVIVVVSGGVALYMNRTVNADKHIQVADATPDVSYVFEEFNNTQSSNEAVEVDEPEEVSYKANIPNADYSLDINETTDVIITVNTKLEGDESYRDYESPIKATYSNFVFGYDNVEKYVTEHNENSYNTVNIPSKAEFYDLKSHADLAMFEFNFTVPDDFPTNDTEQGTIGIKPKFSFEVFSTNENSDKLITSLFEFEVPEFQYIGDDFESFKIGETYNIRYIALMPYGLLGENYGAKLTMTDEMNTSNKIVFNIAPQDIITEKEFTANIENSEEITEENTEITEENTENTSK